MTGASGRLQWHAEAAWRAGRVGAVVALVAGFLLPLLLPAQGVWLVFAVASICLLAGLTLAWAAPSSHKPGEPQVALETAGPAHQVAHALLRAALLLGALGLGLAVSTALGLGA
jgi:hypothetical protein